MQYGNNYHRRHKNLRFQLYNHYVIMLRHHKLNRWICITEEREFERAEAAPAQNEWGGQNERLKSMVTISFRNLWHTKCSIIFSMPKALPL